jgi:hypothetical protein
MSIEDERVIQAAVRVFTRSALRLITEDNHLWSTRPCSTCRTITALLGESFGCDAYRIRDVARRGFSAGESPDAQR